LRRQNLRTGKDDDYFTVNGDGNTNKTLSALPLVFTLPQLGRDVFLAQYVTSSPGMNKTERLGPLFFYSTDRVMRVDDEAVIEATFELNGRNFVYFRHTCWQGCGNTWTELIEIKKDGFIRISKCGVWAT